MGKGGLIMEKIYSFSSKVRYKKPQNSFSSLVGKWNTGIDVTITNPSHITKESIDITISEHIFKELHETIPNVTINL